MLRTLLLATTVAVAHGHGSVLHPPPRQAHGQKYDKRNMCGSNDPYSNATSPGYYCGLGCVGNACLYYAIGCYQNCAECSYVGKTLYPVPEDLVKAGNCPTPPEPTLGGGDPEHEHELRTYNIDNDSELGDWGKWMPWRSPGTAGRGNPGFQPCGVNSGSNPTFPNPPASTEKQFANGTDLSDFGVPATVWKAGSVVDAEWSIYANHGGGYSYRLCKKVEGIPDSKVLTEECYQQTPLDFADDKTTIKFYDNSRDPFTIDAVTTSVGTWPKGSQWRKNPIPMCGCDIGDYCGSKERRELSSGKTCQSVPSPDQCGSDVGTNTCLKCGTKSDYDCEICCPNTTQISKEIGNEKYTWCQPSKGPSPSPSGKCSKDDPRSCYAIPYPKTYFRKGQTSKLCPTGLMFPSQFDEGIGGGVGGTFMFSMTDKLKVPENLEPGNYSLSWRWDCEQTPQVWNSCSDIEII